jgi:hypothetical protein
MSARRWEAFPTSACAEANVLSRGEGNGGSDAATPGIQNAAARGDDGKLENGMASRWLQRPMLAS